MSTQRYSVTPHPIEELRANLCASCIPEGIIVGDIPAYDTFLDQRRRLMAGKIKTWFGSL